MNILMFFCSLEMAKFNEIHLYGQSTGKLFLNSKDCFVFI